MYYLLLLGGYDERVLENVQHLQELNALAIELGLTTFTIKGSIPPEKEVDVVFLPSFTTNQRSYLLSNAQCLLYTPSFEHFGIVPLGNLLFLFI